MKTPSRHSGFTIVEILVVISILGILITIGLVGWGSLTQPNCHSGKAPSTYTKRVLPSTHRPVPTEHIVSETIFQAINVVSAILSQKTPRSIPNSLVSARCPPTTIRSLVPAILAHTPSIPQQPFDWSAFFRAAVAARVPKTPRMTPLAQAVSPTATTL